MILRNYLEELEYECLRGNVEKEVSEVIYDSRKISENCIFVCVKGTNFDGHDAVKDAVEKKAAAVIVERDVEVPSDSDITVVKVASTRYAMAYISAASYDYPAKKLKVIGITGTKGKTTTTYLIKSILENAGYKVGLIGTIEVIIGDTHIHANNTTPESYVLQGYFKQMVDAGIEIVVMEVSSQGLMLHRTASVPFEIGIFTNIEPDHIGPNEHDSFEHYMSCKSMLFRQCRVGILNGDDEHVDEMLKDATCVAEKYGVSDEVDIKAENICYEQLNGTLGVAFDVKGLIDMHAYIDTPGLFSVYNALCAIAVCRHFNIAKEDIIKALAIAKVKGRIEMVGISNDFTVMIDYAHNAMALESLLSTLKEYNPGRLVCLFGCGGNRAKSRRFEMGEVSGKLADYTIITSDNPRFEKPLDIIADIKTGIEKTSGEYIEIPDRYEAIKYSIEYAKKGDVIVLAGKGHEDYQEIEGQKYHMDERELIYDAVDAIGSVNKNGIGIFR